MQLASVSHVDRSINSLDNFIQTNIVGAYIILDEARKFFICLDKTKQKSFGFRHLSTDEVFGDLETLRCKKVK